MTSEREKAPSADASGAGAEALCTDVYSAHSSTKARAAQPPRPCSVPIREGQTLVGTIECHHDRCVARDAAGREIGVFATMQQAARALPRPQQARAPYQPRTANERPSRGLGKYLRGVAAPYLRRGRARS